MNKTVTAKTAKILKSVYDACLGASSESDVFENFYDGGSEQLVSDLYAALKALGVSTLMEPTNRAISEKRVKFAVKTAKELLRNRGLDVSEKPDYYGPDYPKGFTFRCPSPDGDMTVECPLEFQDWSGKSGLGMTVKIKKPNLDVSAAIPVIDTVSSALVGKYFSRPSVKADPGPGVGRSAWFIRFGLKF